MTIKDSKHCSSYTRELSEGCKLCVNGKKLVLFVMGVCTRNCWYCPVADNKLYKDAIYANENKIDSVEEAIKEAKLCEAEGIGITGRDPLTKVDRTIEYIREFKKEFGEKFHIHLYTSFDLVNEENLKRLFKAGLDEIRFHVNILNKEKWNKIEIAKKSKWKIGIEIPCIPNLKEETFSVVEYFKDKVDFINLNELEAADSEHNKIFDKGYKAKNEVSYGIKGSEELGLEVLEKFRDVNIHFCTSRLKNMEQLGNRIKLRSKNVKKDFDILTKNGSLIRGAVYIIKPSFDYLKEVEKIENKEIKLNEIKKKLIDLGIDCEIDTKKYRLLTSKNLAIKNRNKLKK